MMDWMGAQVVVVVVVVVVGGGFLDGAWRVFSHSIVLVVIKKELHECSSFTFVLHIFLPLATLKSPSTLSNSHRSRLPSRAPNKPT